LKSNFRTHNITNVIFPRLRRLPLEGVAEEAARLREGEEVHESTVKGDVQLQHVLRRWDGKQRRLQRQREGGEVVGRVHRQRVHRQLVYTTKTTRS
jgi:hypothetical protein